MGHEALFASNLDLPRFRQGKVRDVYEVGNELLIVATDRISAFDVVLPSAIPDKGKVLNQLSSFWFERFSGVVPNHMISIHPEAFPTELGRYTEVLAGRSMLVRKAQALPIECVVRGFLVGSGWREYQQQGTICSIPLPAGLREAERLPEPIFTPATKVETGHDENISQARLTEIVGQELAERLAQLSLRLYAEASEYARERGVLIADTKFEFGLYSGELMLIDELLTPDSSRFWPATSYRPGSLPPSLDKQPVRDYLEQSGWNKRPPAPELPPAVVASTAARYREVFRRLVGRELV